MNAIESLQQQIERQARPETKAWWDSYLKHAIPFRGVPMAGIRTALHAWLRDEALHAAAPEQQLDLALSLMRERYAEDKLAGILLLQEVLLPGGIRWERDLPRFAALFQEGAIYDWNTCDWFCVRVLGPLAEREGEACARAIAAWRTADNLWQRRGSGVAFVNLARKGDAFFPGFVEMVLETCDATVQSPERFAQTGTGWVLRELSRVEPEHVAEFVTRHVEQMSGEGLRYATAKLPPETRARL